jgi:hypothetical protein
MIRDISSEQILANSDTLGSSSSPLPKHLNLEPDTVHQGLGQLVLTLIDILRQVLEKQALRRMDSGSLTDEEIERLGLTLMKLDEKIDELCQAFGIERKDLNLNLGELSNLL